MEGKNKHDINDEGNKESEAYRYLLKDINK